YSLINHYGGIYSDTDYTFTRGIRHSDFINKHNRVFTFNPTDTHWNSTEFVLNNTTNASPAKNHELSSMENQHVNKNNLY
ncbi:glycosyltransferase, partial [Pseudomonas syringae pv. tagetis]|uniref:hypothetical protein n=1 Tax=Pseudomonas syringae group genomosp. 7 TaxID=251699 RepID=UPI0037702DBF